MFPLLFSFEPLTDVEFIWAMWRGPWLSQHHLWPSLPHWLRCPLFHVLKCHVYFKSMWTFYALSVVYSFLIPHYFNDWCFVICLNICQDYPLFSSLLFQGFPGYLIYFSTWILPLLCLVREKEAVCIFNGVKLTSEINVVRIGF